MMTFLQGWSTKTLAIVGISVVALGSIAYVLWPSEDAVEARAVERGEFVQNVSASGKVVPAEDVQLGFTQSGRIASVQVRVGDRVSVGTVLARLDNSELQALLQQRIAALDSQEAKLAALRQGTRPEEVAVAQAQVDSGAIALAQTQSALLDTVRDAYTVSDSAVRNNVYQFVTNPRSSSPQLNFSTTDSQATVNFLSDVVVMENMLVQWREMATAATEETAADVAAASQANLSSVARLLSDASALLNRAQPNQSVSATAIAGYVSDISSARTSLNAQISALTSASTAVRNAAATLESAERSLALTKAGATTEDIAAQEALVRAAEADVASVRSQIAKTLITAPFTGTVTAVDASAGAIASPNTPLITMIGSGTYQIDSYIPEINIALVKVGDRAEVTLDAYGDEIVFGARVVSIDPAETVRDGVPTYRAVLQFDAHDDRIRSGMTANLVIETDRRDEVISIPVGLVQIDGARKYVRVLSDGAIEERTVTTGMLSSGGRIEILSGLSEGELLVL